MIAKNHNKFTLSWILIAILIAHIMVVFNDFHTDDYEILIIMDDGFDLQAFKSMENPKIFRPFTNLVLYIRSLLLDETPVLWYLLNILLHLITVCLLFYFTKKMINETAAFLTALIFGIYFQHFEAILWLYGIVRLLAAILMLLTLIFHFKLLNITNKQSIFMSYLFYTLALFCVEDIVIFAPFFIIASFIYNQKESNIHWFYNFGYIVLAGLYLVVRAFALHSINPSTGYYFIGEHILSNIYSYFSWLIMPQLNHPHIYPFVLKYLPSFTSVISIINPVIFTIAIIIAVYIVIKGTKAEKLAVLFMIIALIPAIFWEAKVSSKLLYVPSLGFAIAAGSLCYRFTIKIREKRLILIKGMLLLYFLCHSIALNLTINSYRDNHEKTNFFLDKLEQLDIDWDKYEYLLFDNVPGRVRMGHALRYRFRFYKRLIDINQQYEQQSNLFEEKLKLRDASISYILFDFKTGTPVVLERFDGIKLIEKVINHD